MSEVEAERLAWSIGQDAVSVADHAAAMVASYSEVEAARDALNRALDRMAQLAGMPVNDLFQQEKK